MEANGSITLPRRFVALGVLVVAIPFWGFFLAYLYERGYANAFGFDTSYIEISSTSVAAVVYRLTALIVVAGLLVGTVTFGIERTNFHSRNVLYAYTPLEAVVVGGVAYWVAWGFEWSSGLHAAILVLLIAGGLTIFFIFDRRSQPQNRLTRPLEWLVDTGYFPLIAGAVITAAFCYWAGYADATRQTQFDVLKRDETIVVLRRYGDRIIAAPRIEPGVVDTRSLIILKLGESGAEAFARRELGRLRAAP